MGRTLALARRQMRTFGNRREGWFADIGTACQPSARKTEATGMNVCKSIGSGFGPTLALMMLAVVYLALCAIIQNRIENDPAESEAARQLQFPRGSLKFLAYMLTGEIRNPTTRALRALNIVVIAILAFGFLWGSWADSVAARSGCFLS